MILYPKLDVSSDTIALASRLTALSIKECMGCRGLEHPRAYTSPIGGTPITKDRLKVVAEKLTEIAVQNGYPDGPNSFRKCESMWAEWLHRGLGVSPHEAASDSMWHFFTLVLVPDLVRWRWPARNENSNLDHWLTVKHRGRNAFGRLWWRSEILGVPGVDDPYYLVHSLSEDEQVQILERPSLAGHRHLSRLVAQKLVAAKLPQGVLRSDVMRQHQVRMLRLGAFIDFQSLGDDLLSKLIDETLSKAIQGALVLSRKKAEDKIRID